MEQDRGDGTPDGRRHPAVEAEAATLDYYLAECAAWCQTIFTSAGLPHWRKFVRLQANGRWDDDLLQEPTCLQAQLLPGEVPVTVGHIVDRQYGPESKERCAYEIFEGLYHLQSARTAHDMEAALRALHRVHVIVGLARIRFDWEADALVGRRMQKSARQGGQTRAHQRRADHQERLAVWRPAAERLRQAHPTWSTRAIARQISKQTGDSHHTIRKNI